MAKQLLVDKVANILWDWRFEDAYVHTDFVANLIVDLVIKETQRDGVVT